MPKKLSIACLTQLSEHGSQTHKLNLPKLEVEWNTVLVQPELSALSTAVTESAKSHDAVAVDGLPCQFTVGSKVHKLAGMCDSAKFYEGAVMRATLERYLTAHACKQLGDEIKGKRILVLSGLAHYGAADVLNKTHGKLEFADLQFSASNGTQIQSLKSLKKALPEFLESTTTNSGTPPWPTIHTGDKISSKVAALISSAEVILGEQAAIRQFAPQDLCGKIVFTNLHSENDLKWFIKRNAGFVVSLAPVVNGTFVPLSVMEAVFFQDDEKSDYNSPEDYCLNRLQALDFEGAIFDLRSGSAVRYAAQKAPASNAAASIANKSVQDSSDNSEVSKFGFVIHPLSFKHINRLKPIRIASQFFSKEVLEDATSHMKSFKAGTVKNIVSKCGAKAEGLIYAVPVTSKVMLRKPPEFIYKKLIKVARKAHRAGCKVLGLGAYTSVVGDAGVTVSQASPIGITSGNSYTVAATLKTLRSAAEHCGKDLPKCSALVIGATGSIGSICSRMLATDVNAIYLVAPRPEKLLSLAKKIVAETPAIEGKVFISRNVNDFLPLTDIAISTTSTVDAPIDVTLLKTGCVVCDVARPPDIKKQQALARKDILVIETGEIKLLEGAVMNYDIGLPSGTVYACLAETMLLALDKRFGHFTLGREIDPEKVNLINRIADKHGFELADIRSFGEIVPEEHFARLREVNARSSKVEKATGV